MRYKMFRQKDERPTVMSGEPSGTAFRCEEHRNGASFVTHSIPAFGLPLQRPSVRPPWRHDRQAEAT